MNRDEILGALARGYCTDDNQHKVLDSTLLLAMAEEIEALQPQGEAKCSYCGGNDRDMPCAYPSEKKEGCLRDARLQQSDCPHGVPHRYACEKCDVPQGEPVAREITKSLGKFYLSSVKEARFR
jgi:hypothetical protein